MHTYHKIIIGTLAGIGLVAGALGAIHSNQSGTVQSDLVAQHILPDRTVTPGSINPDITQANISQNICNPKWSTSSIRPTSSYTSSLKKKQLIALGVTGSDSLPSQYEEDHLISLELGGNPTDPKNLWPQSYKTVPNARNKDAVENYLHKQVCNGSMTLQEVQSAISTDWVSIYQSMQANAPLGAVSGGLQGIDNDDQ